MRPASIVLALVVALLAGLATPFAQNCWSQLTGRGWYVPAESSLLTFTETRANDGSGEWWIAGEDRANFYAQHPTDAGYLVISRDAAAHCPGFDRFDTTTWCAALAMPEPRWPRNASQSIMGSD